MASRAPLSSVIRFGAFELDAASGELRKAGIPIKLRFQAVQVLLMLTEHAGQVVTREEIRQRLWSADTFVDFERGINFCINQIRAALGDDADEPHYVETLPRRGYRFVAPVAVEVSREPARIVSIAPPSEPFRVPAGSSAEPSVRPSIQAIPVPQAQPAVPRWKKGITGMVTAAFVAASLGVGFGTHKWLARNRAPSLQDLRITKLTNSGAVTGVAISPDGRYVAYAKLEGQRQGLWLHQIAAQSDVQILPLGTSFHGLSFSPDGNYIYFVRSDEHDPYFKYLYAMPALGGPVRKLLTDVDSPVSFSPDGRQFVYEHCVEGRDDIELRVANGDGNNDHLLTMIHHGSSFLFQPGPSWSPDGLTIAVPVSLVGPQTHWVLDAVLVSNGSVRELFSISNWIGRPVWMRNDTLLVPLYEPVVRRAQLWTISFPEGKASRLTNDLTSYGAVRDDYGFPLDASHDRKALVALATAQTSKVWLAPAAAPWQAKEVTNNEFPLYKVAEAADGRLWSVSDGQLWIMSADGSQGAPYGDYRDIDSIATCGPFMILAHREEGPVTLTRLGADGKHPVGLASGRLFGPVCSPDGKFVFFGNAEQPQKICRVPVIGGAPVEIAQVLGDQVTSQPSISPDGSLIAYGYTKYFPTPEWNMAVIPADGGPPRMTMPIPPAEIAGPYWSPDGKGFQYLWTRNGVTNLWEQPLSGGKPKQLTKFTSGMTFYLSWSFDRKRLLLTRGEIRSDAVLLNNFR